MSGLVLRAAAASAVFLLFCNCSGPGHYPLSGQSASASDPVHEFQAHHFLFPEASF